MKNIIALALIFALGFQFLSKLGLISYYLLNKDFIIEEYCENKNEPQLKCEGTCFLKKGLEKNEANDKEQAETVKSIEIPSFLISSYLQEKPLFTWRINFLKPYHSSYYYLCGETPFHPPKPQIA